MKRGYITYYFGFLKIIQHFFEVKGKIIKIGDFEVFFSHTPKYNKYSANIIIIKFQLFSLSPATTRYGFTVVTTPKHTRIFAVDSSMLENAAEGSRWRISRLNDLLGRGRNDQR